MTTNQPATTPGAPADGGFTVPGPGTTPGPAYEWTPLHTPALARAILNHPATAHLPAQAITHLINAAGHDLAQRARNHLAARITPTQARHFLSTHTPHNPAPGQAWISAHLPAPGTLLTETTAAILTDIAHGPYQYLNTHNHP
jgi:hypothetical protein